MKNILSLLLIFTQIFIVTPSKAAITEPDRQQLSYRNELTNGSFQNKGARWTASSGTLSTDTTNFFDGTQSGLMTMSASAGNLQSSATPAQQYQGVQMEASCYVKTSLSTVSFCAMANSVEQQCISVPSTNIWNPIAINFTGPSNGQSIGVEIKSTSTTGTYNVSGCYVGRARNVGSAAISTDWKNDLTFTASAGFGTVTNSSIFYRQVGDTMEVQGSFIAGTVAASAAFVQLPAGFTINTSKMNTNSNSQVVGTANVLASGTSTFIAASSGVDVSFYDGSTNNQIFITNQYSSNAFTKNNTSTFVSSGNTITFKFTVPITQYSSSYGTMSTAVTPSSWSGFTDVTGNWTTTNTTYTDASNATGIALTQSTNTNFGSVVTASGSLAGFTFTPVKVGGYKVCAYASLYNVTAGKITSASLTDGTTQITQVSYRDQTGNSYSVIPICGIYNATSIASTTLKIQIKTDSGGTAGLGYNGSSTGNVIGWDIYEINVNSPSPILTRGTGSGIYETGTPTLGSAGSNKIYSYPTTTTNTGNCITYARDTVNGDTATINCKGVYAVQVNGAGGTNQQGVSVMNAGTGTNLTTSITSLTIAQGQKCHPGAANGVNANCTVLLNINDVVRAHSDAGGTIGSAPYAGFHVTLVNLFQ